MSRPATAGVNDAGTQEVSVDYPKGIVVAGTGHRFFKSDVQEIVQDWISNMLATIEPVKVVSGMAIGFDTWLAQEAVKQHIPLIAAIPFEGQHLKWPEKQRDQYRKLIRLAETRRVICPGDYEPWKFQRRNEWMVDNCSLLLAAWDGSGGGTANCVSYAKKVGRPVEFLPGLKPEAI
jgi:uncharacterized phage-like protein YoqJ